MTALYRIKPLEWEEATFEGETYLLSENPIGVFEIHKASFSGGYYWIYDDRNNQGKEGDLYDFKQEAMQDANEHYIDLLLTMLEPAGKSHEK